MIQNSTQLLVLFCFDGLGENGMIAILEKRAPNSLMRL